MVLRTEGARLNGIAFLVGWALSLSVLFTLGFIAVGAGLSGHPTSTQQTWALAAQLVLAALLLLLAARRWRHRDEATAPHTTPQAIRRRLDQLNPRKAGFLGVLIQPRTLTIAAALIVARERSGIISALVGLGVFALLSTGALLAIFTYFVRRPDNAQSNLAVITSRLEQAGPTILTVVFALAGAYLLVNALIGLIR
jgi:hypothetical protein